MKIAIIGKAKTGTTAIHAAVSGSAPAPQHVLFEPKTPEEIRPALEGSEPVTAKVIFEHWKNRLPELAEMLEAGGSAAFDKVVFIKRDPRDEIVSRMLYFVFPMFEQGNINRDQMERWKAVLQAKDNDKNLPFRDICKKFSDIFSVDIESNVLMHAVEDTKIYQEFLTSVNMPFHVIFYEDFIDDDLKNLSKYLGYNVRKYNVQPEFARVRRTAGYGDWKNMMTESDVQFLRAASGSIFSDFGYWDWRCGCAVDNNTSYAGYVERIVGSKFAKY